MLSLSENNEPKSYLIPPSMRWKDGKYLSFFSPTKFSRTKQSYFSVNRKEKTALEQEEQYKF